MSDRPTPEVDAWLKAWGEIDFEGFDDLDDHPLYTEEFARKLERERDEARELVRELRDALEFMLEGGLEGPTPQAMRGAQDVLTKAEEVLP